MENEFTRVMIDRSDDELVKIITIDRKKYKAEAIEAAEYEIEKRNIDTNTINHFKQVAEENTTIEEEVTHKRVGAFTRFIHFIIDSILAYMVAFVVIYIYMLIIGDTSQSFILSLVYLILFVGAFLAYYAVMEMKFQKTVGKFITKTKVVNYRLNKPTNERIMIRTICRIVPLDHISFLFLYEGFHDTLSKTKVIKDT